MLELMVVGGALDLETGVKAEVEREVVGGVEDLSGELDDWTEEKVVGCSVALDD